MDKKSAEEGEAATTNNESIAYGGGIGGDKTTKNPKEEEEELSSLPERVLYFSTDFVDWIITGKKKATTRVDKFVFLEDDGITTYQEIVGDLQKNMKLTAVDDDERSFAVLLVTNVEKRTYGSLDDNIAQIENFKNKKGLCDALGRFYKDLRKDSELVVIYFDVLRSLL